MKTKYWHQSLGFLISIAGLLLNKQLVIRFFVPGDLIFSSLDRLLIYIFDISMLIIGVTIFVLGNKTITYIKGLLPNLALAFISICLVILLPLEIFLRIDPLNMNDHLWITAKDQKINRKINKKNEEFSKQNMFKFNDKDRDIKKNPNIKRLAILGDSFIWGDGLGYNDIWSHKLEEKISEKWRNIEVISWGQRGWSTKNELEFLKKNGYKFKPNLLIIGFVTNDPDFGEIEMQDFDAIRSHLLTPLKIVFPESTSFISSYLNNTLIKLNPGNIGYEAWENKLYTQNNLVKYKKKLKELLEFTKKEKIDILIVFTPDRITMDQKNKIQKIKIILDEIDIPYLDIFPQVYKKFKNRNPYSLWANKANSHPGSELTETYCTEVYNYLIANHYSKIFAD